ncbi:MAG TPA: alpha/beta hydrolase [Ilumatobacteraceae bacterium]|mgnify:CR=1 FL=1|nr:alpha/beta hydrolase [Ilumatobacteraceae bacterium]HRB03060.1 alpha/beta hydrolase [Ilumatobacteraceae bacterium]
MEQAILNLTSGRRVGYAVVGPTDGTPVIWCHGGPGSRLEPAEFEAELYRFGLRAIGIDRPGYGHSSLLPERTIADWVPDATAVAAAMELERFLTVGVSTGGAYALALASMRPDRVLAALVCCAMSDMRDEASRSSLCQPICAGIWNAPDRGAAVEFARSNFGDRGERMMSVVDTPLCPADQRFVAENAEYSGRDAANEAKFANGVLGYVDDRRADGQGWASFDIADLRCPVTVMHGSHDTIVGVSNARHTAALIPHSSLQILDEQGHVSVLPYLFEPLAALAANSRMS